MRFLIVSDPGRCNIWQVFDTGTPVATGCKQETGTDCEQVYDVVFNGDTACFAGYKGGTGVNTGNHVYTENI